MKIYNDSNSEAKKKVERSDRARSEYYKIISNQNWNDISNYDFAIDSSIGVEKCADIICEYVKKIKKIIN